jgi:methyl-accepting chemotaxis protein
MPSEKPTRTDALRQAVDDAFQAAADQAQTTRGRAQEFVDELAGAAGRLRGAAEQLRPPTGEDLRQIRAQIDELGRRVSALEANAQAQAPTARRGARTPARASAKGKPARGRSAGTE